MPIPFQTRRKMLAGLTNAAFHAVTTLECKQYFQACGYNARCSDTQDTACRTEYLISCTPPPVGGIKVGKIFPLLRRCFLQHTPIQLFLIPHEF